MPKTGTRKFDAAFKARVALEAIKAQKTIQELTGTYGVHSTQISNWKKQGLEGFSRIFSEPRATSNKPDDALVAMLYQQIGQLKVELDWLKKKCDSLG
jgi:putative transposase